jgi:hypothetical protein
MTIYTTWYIVLVVQQGRKDVEVRSPGTDEEFEAQKELDLVRKAMKEGDWIDLPWFTARADTVTAAYLDSTSVGFV